MRTSLPFLIALLGCNGTATETPTETPTGEPTAEPTPEPTPMPMDLVDTALADEQFSTLTGAIVQAGLEETLRGPGPFTVFAPTNAAFEAAGIDPTTLSNDELATVLTHHVVAGEVPSTGIPALADSVAGFTLFFDTSDGVRVDGASVTTPDVQTTNGLIHVVDDVLLPPTLLDAVGRAGLTGLADAVGAADPAVAALLAEPGDYTVLAPTNEAFDAASSITATLDTAGLTDVLTYHVLPAAVGSGELPAASDTLLVNAWGDPVTALFAPADATVNGTGIVITDIHTTNGTVHVVEDVLLPPTVVDHAEAAGLTELLGAVGAASGDLGTTLSGDGPFTVFAPTNDAFTSIASTTATLSADQLRDVLLFHVVGGDAPVKSTDLAPGEVPTLLTDASVTVETSPAVAIEDAGVVSVDIHGTNGTVHVVDAVLLPPSE